jgi:DNA invertase Pin-like site-specific DNA recombinase
MDAHGPGRGAGARPEKGRSLQDDPAKLRLAMAAMGQPETKGSALCKELGITRQTLYRYVGPQGELHRDGHKLLGARVVG